MRIHKKLLRSCSSCHAGLPQSMTKHALREELDASLAQAPLFVIALASLVMLRSPRRVFQQGQLDRLRLMWLPRFRLDGIEPTIFCHDPSTGARRHGNAELFEGGIHSPFSKQRLLLLLFANEVARRSSPRRACWYSHAICRGALVFLPQPIVSESHKPWGVKRRGSEQSLKYSTRCRVEADYRLAAFLW